MAGLQIEIFLLMAIGWWMGKTGRLSKQTRSQLTDLVIMVILPCAIIRSFQMDLSEDVLMSTLLILMISFIIQILYALCNMV